MVRKIKVLNLYAGIGGNRKNWKNVEVTAVENNPEVAECYKKLFSTDEVIVADAHQFLLENFNKFDFIWSSPPCQSHSKMNKFTRHKTIRYFDMKLYQEIILLSNFFKGLWVVENVEPYYKPLIEGKKLGRHFIWSNFEISDFEIKTPNNFTKCKKEVLIEWLGLDIGKNVYLNGNHCPGQIYRNCVHPNLGEHIFLEALRNLSPTSHTLNPTDSIPTGEFNMGDKVSATPTPKDASHPSHHPNISEREEQI